MRILIKIAFPLISLAMFVGAPIAHAVPARPVALALQQPDGSRFKAHQRGDENRHWIETAAGHPIARDAKHGWWVYTQPGGKALTARRVGRDAPPTARWQPAPAAPSVRRTSPRGITPRGVANIPVILVNFPDRTPLYNASDFNRLLFGDGTGSMADYYREVSRGAFTVAPGPGGVVGWYTAQHPHDYYGANQGGYAGADAHPGALVREAVVAAAAAGFDFSPYDSDGDGYVDVVNIIHQGTGEESVAQPNDIWSQRWSLNDSGDGQYQTASGVKVNDFVIEPELLELDRIMTIGVFCHEYGHALGLPDLYDIDLSSEGVGRYSLMASGVWTRKVLDGDSPAHLDAWSKLHLGWNTAVEPTANLPGAALDAVEIGGPIYRLRDARLPTTEYFLVENRQQTGFDAGLPDAGLAIYHVDDTLNTFPFGNGANMQEWYPGHTAEGHYFLAIEQADGRFDLEKKTNRGDAGDLYAAMANGFGGDTLPNSRAYDGTVTRLAVRNISASGATITADIYVADPNAPPDMVVYNASVVEGNTSAAQLNFVVALTAPATHTVTVLYSTADGTARVGVDYNAASGALAFAPGETKHTVTVTVRPDALVEPNETMRLRLASASGAVLRVAEAIGTIINDDVAPIVTQMWPDHGVVGQTVALQGAFLTNATTAVPVVKFGTVAATSVVVDSVARIRAVVPPGAATNYVTLQNSSGAARSPVPFTVVPPVTLTSFTPTSGPVGQVVTITGSGLVNVLTTTPIVRFGGVASTAVTVVAPTMVRAVVPPGAITSRISVANAAGIATSSNLFTVTPTPRAAGEAPRDGSVALRTMVSTARVNDTAIEIVFSAAIDLGDARYRVQAGNDDVPISGMVYNRATRTLTLATRGAAWSAGERIVVTITGARDARGAMVSGEIALPAPP